MKSLHMKCDKMNWMWGYYAKKISRREIGMYFLPYTWNLKNKYQTYG